MPATKTGLPSQWIAHLRYLWAQRHCRNYPDVRRTLRYAIRRARQVKAAGRTDHHIQCSTLPQAP